MFIKKRSHLASELHKDFVTVIELVFILDLATILPRFAIIGTVTAKPNRIAFPNI